MSLRDMQQQTDRWTGQFTPQYWPPLEILARLVEETGEVSRELLHRHGIKKKKSEEPVNSLDSELADILFAVCCLANSEGIDLERAWNEMFREKLEGRDAQRFAKKT